jgi:uncharacterized phage infection (PIP) family protein YhgE
MPPPGVTFDSAPVPASATPPPGVVFDTAPVPDSTDTTSQTGTTAQPNIPVPSALHRDANGNPILNAAKMLPEIGAGIGEGVLDTLNGGASMLRLPHATLQARQNELTQQNRENPVLNTTGKLTENVAEFLGGDEALKSLALSDKLLKVSRIAKVLEGSPLAMRAFNIGVDALRSGTAQGTIAGMKDHSLSQGATQGGIAAGVTGALGIGGEALTAIRGALDSYAIQAPLQQGIRDLLSDVADKIGVAKPTAPSIRDAAQQVSDGLKARASGLYQTLDNISGGQAQRFRDAAQNVSDKLSEIVGLDDEQEAKLVAQQAKIDAAHREMLKELEAKGYDRNMLAQADAAWTQQSALSDLSNSIRQSTGGLRPELADGVKDATTPEAVNPKTLFTKVNRLNDRGRLAQAIGQDNADALLRHVDAAYVQGQRIAERNKWAGYIAKAAGTVGLGGVGYGAVHLAHELLGGGQ